MSGIGKELKYSIYLIFHPFKGYWDIKHEKLGSLITANIFLVLFILTRVLDGLYCGYLVNGTKGGVHFNVLQCVISILAVYFIWCTSNWCLTSLFDGEGTFKDICMATSYALVPMIVFQLLCIPLSHFITSSELSFYNFMLNIATIWSVMLLIISVIVTHQYTLTKSIVIILSTIAGMCMIFYIIILFFSLFQQIFGFGYVLFKEISLRLS